MGKTKTKRNKMRDAGPACVPSIRAVIDEWEEIDPHFETATVDSIIEKLQSPGPDEKECAAYAIASRAGNADFVAALIENKVIRIAAPLLVDPNMAVRHAIAGCLRNLTVCGDHTVSQALVEQDVMTALVCLIQEYKESWVPAPPEITEDISEEKIDSKTEIFLEACNLLWSLCESSNTAVEIFNDSNIISVLLPCLNTEIYGLQIPLAIAQCLHTVAEDNTVLIDILSQSLKLEQLKSLMSLKPTDAEHILLKTLAAGIILNIYSGKLDNCMPIVTVAILEVISCALDVPILPDLEKLCGEITSYKTERFNKCHEEEDLEKKLFAMNETVKKLDHTLPSKQIALEVLTNICFGDDSKDEWDDLSNSDTSEEACMDIEDDTSSTPFKLVLRVPCEAHGIIVRDKLLDKVMQQIVIPPVEVSKMIMEISKGKDCLKRLGSVRCRALLCINNMVQSLDMEDLGGRSVLFDLWLNLAELVFKKTDISNTEQLEAATSSMRAVLQKLAEADCSSQFSQLTESDIQLLMDICHQSQDSAVKVNIIRAVGTIGCLLGNSGQGLPSKVINVIGSFLLEICTKTSEMWVIAEALDVIFDVFSEDHLDGIAQEITLVEKLTHLLPLLKGKIKQQRKSLGEHLPIIMTAKTNLLRFIKYKNDQNKR